MRFSLIVLILAITACKSENQIKPRPWSAPAETKSELPARVEVPELGQPDYKVFHDEGQSVLREKLMTKLINKHLEKKSEKTSDVSIKWDEELKLKNNESELSAFETEEYSQKSFTHARIVISLPKQILVYFAKPGLVLKDLLSDKKGNLQLLTTEEKSAAGKVYYAISVSKEELLNYDNKTFVQSLDNGSFSESMHLKLRKGQEVTARINFNYYVENALLKTFVAPGVRCYKGNCTYCNFSREVPGNSLVKKNNASLEEIGLTVSAGGMNYPLSIFKPLMTAADQVELNLTDVLSGEAKTYDLVLSLNIRTLTQKMEVQSLGFQCGEDREMYSEISQFKTKADAKVTLIIKGHGDLLNDIALK